MMVRIKTSISIEDTTWKEFRKKCIDVGEDASTILEKLMADWLKK